MSPRRKLLLGLFLLVVFLFLGRLACAGELGLAWEAVTYPYPVTYEVFAEGDKVLDTASTSVVVAARDGCVDVAYTVVAVGHLPSGSLLPSAPSPPVTSMARPTLATTIWDTDGVHTLGGTNFPVDVQVWVNGVRVPQGSVERVDCSVVRIPTTGGTPYEVTVRNEKPAGPLAATWTIPPPVEPVGLGVR